MEMSHVGAVVVLVRLAVVVVQTAYSSALVLLCLLCYMSAENLILAVFVVAMRLSLLVVVCLCVVLAPGWCAPPDG